MVQNVECVRSGLEIESSPQMEITPQRDVELRRANASQGVSAESPLSLLHHRRSAVERGGIDPSSVHVAFLKR